MLHCKQDPHEDSLVDHAHKCFCGGAIDIDSCCSESEEDKIENIKSFYLIVSKW